MIVPLLKDEAFLTDVRNASEAPTGLHLWWLGQSGFLVQWRRHRLLIDPYLSDALTKKYAGTERPHVRMTERVIAPQRLDGVEVATSSHNHTDHLDAHTLGPLLEANPDLAILVPRANTGFAAARLGVSSGRLTAIAPGTPVTIGPFTFHGVPAAHEELTTDERGDPTHIGLIVEVASWTLYHSGDTVRYPGMAERLNRWRIDLALLPINGRDPARGVAGNLSGPEAAELARDLGAGLVVPCHFEMFEFNTASPEAFVRTAEAIGQPYRVLRAGERLSLPAQPFA